MYIRRSGSRAPPTDETLATAQTRRILDSQTKRVRRHAKSLVQFSQRRSYDHTLLRLFHAILYLCLWDQVDFLVMTHCLSPVTVDPPSPVPVSAHAPSVELRILSFPLFFFLLLIPYFTSSLLGWGSPPELADRCPRRPSRGAPGSHYDLDFSVSGGGGGELPPPRRRPRRQRADDGGAHS